MFEKCPGYLDTLILQNQENYKSRFKPLKFAISDQKRTINDIKYPKFPYFSNGSCKQMYMDPFGKVTCKTLEVCPSEY